MKKLGEFFLILLALGAVAFLLFLFFSPGTTGVPARTAWPTSTPVPAFTEANQDAERSFTRHLERKINGGYTSLEIKDFEVLGVTDSKIADGAFEFTMRVQYQTAEGIKRVRTWWIRAESLEGNRWNEISSALAR